MQDFGVGMSEERRITILNGHESYTSTGTHGEKGTGLGLSIVKDFIERQKGTLLIESAMVNGSSLYIKWSLHTISFIALFADSHHCISINFLLSFTSPDPLYLLIQTK